MVEKFDSLCYLNEVCKDKFLAIVMIARIHLSQFENSGFQEKVFSTAGNAMKLKQTKMNSKLLEMCALLCHNKDLIRHGII